VALPVIRAGVKHLGWLASALALPAYLAVAVAVFLPAWRDPQHLLVGYYGDPKFFVWVLGWIPKALATGSDPLLTTDLNYPAGVNLMWNNSVPLVGFLLSPITALAGPTASYNAAITVGLAVSAWCAHMVMVRLGLSRPGALVGGLLYGFSPYMLAQSLAHLPIVIGILPPLALLFLHELVVRQSAPAWRTGALLGGVAGAQVLISLELLATTVLLSAVGVVLLLAAAPRQVLGQQVIRGGLHALRGLYAALCVSALVAAVPLAVMFFGPQRVGGALRDPDIYVNDAAGFLVPTPVFWLAPPSLTSMTRSWSGHITEWNGYVGIPLALLLAWIIGRNIRVPVVRWAALVGLVAAVLSMGPHLHVNGAVNQQIVLPWALVLKLPVLANLLPSRLAIYLFLCAGILLGVFVGRLGSPLSGWRSLAGWLAVVVALLPLVPHEPTPVINNSVPPFFFPGGDVDTVPRGSVVLVLPFATDPGTLAPGPATWTAVDSMTWQAYAGYRFRMPSGYVIVPGPGEQPSHGPVPTSTSRMVIDVAQGGPQPVITPELRNLIAADFEHWDVEFVVVGPMRYQAGERELVTRLLNRPPEEVGGIFLWRHVDPAEIRTGS
jgi:hypothetical protein